VAFPLRLVLVGSLALVAACGDRGDAGDSGARDSNAVPVGNLFENPSLEEGREPWFSLASPERPYWADFDVTREQAHSGAHSAILRVRSEGYTHHTRVYGLLRELEGGPLPKKVSGFYRVESWRRGAARQYIQVVVAVKGAPVFSPPEQPKQIAYVLAGIEEPPFRILNRRFQFHGPREPVQGRWIRFEFSIARDFQRLWGATPDDYDTLRVFFEARFDQRRSYRPPVYADVYFDDLYLGR